MTPQQYIEWLDEQIAKCKTYIADKRWGDDVRTHQYGRLNAFWESKNRFAMFIALQKPTQPIDPQEPEPENNFTNGLG